MPITAGNAVDSDKFKPLGLFMKSLPRYFIVYNTCYGGFSISDKAMDLMCEYGHPLAIEIRANYSNGHAFGYIFSEIPRHDPILIRVVRELGSEADGEFARLDITEINTPMYRIEEYDGKEWVETPDSVDWVIIE